mmetsp:Transcript_9301/g.23367  ORF Transcript_9301/g.23367 Transcript_9301/m.23367 type:complete len:300 (+) Transcript_9301:992-1891(+)
MGNSGSGGGSGSSSEAQWNKYHTDLEEWEKTVAAQQTYEAKLAWRERPLACDKLLYCVQGCGGLIEIPLRILWHGSCSACVYTLCLPCACPVYCASGSEERDAVCAAGPGALLVVQAEGGGGACNACIVRTLAVFTSFYFHHLMSVCSYTELCEMVSQNVCWQPCDPHPYVFAAETSLVRPKKPTPPVTKTTKSSNDPCACDCVTDPCEMLTNCLECCNAPDTCCVVDTEKVTGSACRDVPLALTLALTLAIALVLTLTLALTLAITLSALQPSHPGNAMRIFAQERVSLWYRFGPSVY